MFYALFVREYRARWELTSIQMTQRLKLTEVMLLSSRRYGLVL